MFAFRAKDEAQVQAFHTAALEHGGSVEGAPGTRPYYPPTFYVAYVRDPDGYKLACVYQIPIRSEFEDRAVAVRTATDRGAIEIPVGPLDQSGLRVLAVAAAAE